MNAAAVDWLAFMAGPGMPHGLVVLVSFGMAAAFVVADRARSSQALAVALMSMGVAILGNVSFQMRDMPSPELSGWLAIPEGLSLSAFLEWLLCVRRTVPSGNRDVRLGDVLLRVGQAMGPLYIVFALLWPRLRAEYFIGSINHGFAVLDHGAFWLFAAPLLIATLTGLAAILLLFNRRPERSERARVLGFVVASPLLLSAFILPPHYAMPMVMLGLMVVLVGAVQYHVMQGQRGQFLSRFLSPQVAALVNERGLSRALHQDHLEISVVCCDLRGFTKYASVHPSSQVIEVLREYYEAVGKVVSAHGGTVKDYAGDGILILVGAPLPMPDHAHSALVMATQIRLVVTDITQRHSSRKAKLGVGVGVASGFVTVGAIGSDSRLEYTAVGSAVNLASRLCEEADDQEILIAPRSLELLRGVELNEREVSGIKGFAGVTRVASVPPRFSLSA